MKRLNNYFVFSILFIMLISIRSASYAQSLHAIVFCNTIDVNIGCAVDEENILNELAIIATETGLDYKPYVKHGEACTKGNLFKILNELNCGTNDVVFFYYSGHGAHSAQQMGEKFPQLCMKYNSTQYQNEFVSVKTIDEIITKKSPRLNLIITDCCNNVISNLLPRMVVSEMKGATIVSNTSSERLKKLFLYSRGKVKITSSKLKQQSAGNKEYGGLFTNALIDVLAEVEDGKLEPDWYKIAAATKTLVLNWSQREQEPDDEISVSSTSSMPTPTPSPTPSPNTTITPLAQHIQFLLDKSVSESVRIQRIPLVLADCFKSGAKVKTVGRNLTTIVAYEDAADFLSRITASPYIKNITIIKQADSGRNSEITVHEIRNYQ